MSNNRKTQTEKVLDALMSGQSFTVKAAAHRLRMTPEQVAKAVYSLKENGYMIYSNRVKGSTKVEYRLGTPSRAVVRAGIQALRAEGIAI